jgi:uncharacterized protein (TIGR02996 family)
VNDHDRFIRAIVENPFDDAPRLIFADWLEEHGDAARAEFIRVQCEVARMVEPEKGMCGCIYGSCDKCTYRRKFARHKNSLRCRERKLWGSWPDEDDVRSKVHAEWQAAVGEGWVILPATYAGDLGDASPAALVHRGFVAAVTCSLADWCGKECHCGNPERPRNYPPCPSCDGSGRVGALGVQLVLAAPITEVHFTDADDATAAKELIKARVQAGLENKGKTAYNTEAESASTLPTS